MKIKSLLALCLCAFVVLLTGCTSTEVAKQYAENGQIGYRTTVRQRGVGLWFETPDPSTGSTSMKIKAGFFSSTVERTPVATNQVYEANHFDTFESEQSGYNPFSFSYNETSGSGFVSTTNSGGMAIIPKAGVPPRVILKP